MGRAAADRFTFGYVSERLARIGDLPRLYEPGYQPPLLARAIADAGIENAEEVAEACDVTAACAAAEGAVDGARVTREDAASIAMYTYSNGDNGPYRLINTAIVERNVMQLRRARGLIYRLLRGLRNLPPTQSPALFRGIRARVNLDQSHFIVIITLRGTRSRLLLLIWKPPRTF